MLANRINAVGLVGLLLALSLTIQSPAQQYNRMNAQQQQQMRSRIQPDSIIRVAIDYDRDGQIDDVDYLSAYDLERARRASRQRMNRQQQQDLRGQRQMRPGQMRRGQMMGRQTGQQPDMSRAIMRSNRMESRRQDIAMVRGDVREVREFRLAGMDQPQRFLKINTDQGRTRIVSIGPVNQLENTVVDEGDQVAIATREGSINGNPVLMALSLTTQDGETRIQMPHDRGLSVLQGSVEEVHEGEVVILVRPATIDGEMGFVAEQLRIDDRTITIETETQTRMAQAQDQQGQQQQQ